jgi:hypothetical protein
MPTPIPINPNCIFLVHIRIVISFHLSSSHLYNWLPRLAFLYAPSQDQRYPYAPWNEIITSAHARSQQAFY